MERSLQQPPTAGRRLRLADLPARGATAFQLVPDASDRAAIAAALGISAVRKLRFAGQVLPEGSQDWRLDARLGATVVQPCVVTLEPVTTRIEERVARYYARDLPELPAGSETEMPDDDAVEPLPAVLDLHALMCEALALALPAYPRAEGAELGEAVFTETGGAPLTDADLKPFAGLKSLRDKLADGESE